MFLAMNRFKVAKGKEVAFETLWRERDSHLEGVPGFKAFRMMKGQAKDDHVLYASHSVWESEEAFRNWTRSEAFRMAHKGAGDHGDLYLGPPELELFDAVEGI